MSKRTSIVTLGAIAAAICASSALGQSIVDGAHNFSTMGWADGEICKPCHIPHFSNEEVGYLWNHELTTATYDMHEGSGTAEVNFDKNSRMCLSCHDGTVALDSFGGETGSSFIPPSADVGTDLTNDHPVGSDAVYPLEGSTRFNPAPDHKVNGMRLRRWIDGNGDEVYVVGCSTCHTPHYKGFDHQLSISNDASAMCLSCHIK